ncbi:MAG TPA: enoyl-CoA hydratase/isomerase family protein [Acidimicrobiales bacterium]
MATQRIEGLNVAQDGGVLRLQLDRPERKNALTDEIVAGLIESFDAAGSDESVRAIVLSGTGEHFCSGFDLTTRAPSGPEKPRVGAIQRRMGHQVNRLIPAMLECQTPIVAAAQGWVIGLGLNLVLASDFAVVADDARLWAPFTEFGFTPDSGASWLIPRLVGVARAKEMLLLGRKVDGAKAAEWGLVHDAVPADELDRAAEALTTEVASAPTVAVGLSKLLVHRGLTADLHRHLAEEGFAMEVSSRSEDFAEYHRARRERRPPEFRGR